jgi:antitoxin component of MazEF toxin-antitoxin module
MERKIVELGGSLVITIPKTLTEIHDLKSGMKLKMQETKDGLLILYPDEETSVN